MGKLGFWLDIDNYDLYKKQDLITLYNKKEQYDIIINKNTEYINTRIALFNIYDGVLAPEYGANHIMRFNMINNIYIKIIYIKIYI